MNTATILPIVRHLLQLLAGILIAKGLLDQGAGDELATKGTEVIGGVLSIVSIVWMVRSKKQAPPAVPAIAAAALLALGLGAGCSAIAPGNDPAVVNAERTTAAALEAFDTFLLWEFQNRDTLAQVPKIRKAADHIRANGQAWLATARTLTKAYKNNRTPENKANLATAVEVLKAATKEAQAYLLNPK